MRGQTLVLLCCAALLTACSYVMGPPNPLPPDKAPEPPPDARQILRNSTDSLFDPTAKATDVGIGEVRRFDTAFGQQYGVCMRARVRNREGKPLGNTSYVIIFVHNRIADRRRALPADGCDGESYQPVS